MKHLFSFRIFESGYSGDENYIPKTMLNKELKNVSKSLNHSLNNKTDSMWWPEDNNDLFIGRSEREEKRDVLKTGIKKNNDYFSKAEFRIIKRDKLDDLNNKIQLLKDFYNDSINDPEYEKRISNKYYYLRTLRATIVDTTDFNHLKKLASLESEDIFDFYNKFSK